MTNRTKKIKKLLKIAMLSATLSCTCFSLTGCDGHTNINKNSEFPSTENPENIPSGNYLVLDTRETMGRNDLQHFFLISLIIQDSDGNRFYYSYECKDKKNNVYMRLAKLVSGDNVQYSDGFFTLIKGSESNE